MLLPHPAADCWPMMDDATHAELTDDIRVNGQQHSIKLYKGMILDGRNRYKAVLELGIEPWTEEFTCDNKEEDATDLAAYDYVISANGKRRDLIDVRRLMCIEDTLKLKDAAKAIAEKKKEVADRARAAASLGNQNATRSSTVPAQEMRTPNTSQVATPSLAQLYPPPPPANTVKFPPPPYLPPPAPPPTPEPVRDRVAEEERTTRAAVAKLAGVGRRAVELNTTLTRYDDANKTNLRQQVKEGTITVVEAKREINKSKLAEKIAFVPPEGKFGTIVIDPPWQMEKIEREVAPDQIGFDYPTMSLDELAVFPVGDMAADDCHIFCWTTQKLLPATFDLLTKWGFKYVLTMVWHKPGGFQPFNLPQYNCEFIVYGRRGSVVFADTKAFNCCFNGPRREHSRKPDNFYDTIRRVTSENARRIDVFSREPRDGFEQYGNEVDKFAGAA